MNDTIAQTIWILLVLLMVGSSLLSRRLSFARLLSWAAGWVALFFGAYLLFTWLEPKISVWQQNRRSGEVAAVTDANSLGTANGPIGNASGTEVTIAMQNDGHFWVDTDINGQQLRFLIDSGAGITAVSQATANKLGLVHDPMNRTVLLQTANGPIRATRSVIPVMRVGSILATDLPVVVSPSFGEVNLLGMNFLTKLKSWRVEDGLMILEPQ